MVDLLTELCGEVRNYFLHDGESNIHAGTFTIANGSIEPLPFLIEGQYFRIVGSALNDGVWQYPASGLKDEVFTGAVWAMFLPPSFIALAAEIDDWVTKNKDTLDSPYSSESFGGYAYSKGVSASGGAYSWKDQFASRLNQYRRLNVL